MNKLLNPVFFLAATFLVACSSSNEPEVVLSLDQASVDALYQRVDSMSIQQLQADTDAMEVAHWLFSQNCSSCHQADAKGRMGVPDLTDQYWLFEGTEESIRQTITSGRIGVMPEFGSQIGEMELGLLVSYVESLSTQEELGANELTGQAIYQEFCIACHAEDGSGVANLGPSLTDEAWQWGGNMITIRQSITTGRNAECPAHGELLSSAQIELLTAYLGQLES